MAIYSLKINLSDFLCQEAAFYLWTLNGLLGWVTELEAEVH